MNCCPPLAISKFHHIIIYSYAFIQLIAFMYSRLAGLQHITEGCKRWKSNSLRWPFPLVSILMEIHKANSTYYETSYKDVFVFATMLLFYLVRIHGRESLLITLGFVSIFCLSFVWKFFSSWDFGYKHAL